MTHDVFTLGEAMLRFSVPAGGRLESAPAFDVHVAGTELNVAVALARLGRRVAWASRVPPDPLGRRVLDSLRAAGVDPSAVVLAPGERLGTYFVELHAPPRPVSVTYDRRESAASLLGPDDLPWDAVDDAVVVHLTGITPALSPSCRAAVEAVAERRRSRGGLLSLDVNFRAKLWSAQEAAEVVGRLVELADLVVCTHEDAADVFGIEGDPPDRAREMAARSHGGIAVVTAGEEGAWWRTPETSGHEPAMPVVIVDRLGAGDAFTAGVLDGLLDGDPAAGVRRGAALAAIALGTCGDQVSVTREELEALTARRRRVDR